MTFLYSENIGRHTWVFVMTINTQQKCNPVIVLFFLIKSFFHVLTLNRLQHNYSPTVLALSQTRHRYYPLCQHVLWAEYCN